MKSFIQKLKLLYLKLPRIQIKKFKFKSKKINKIHKIKANHLFLVLGIVCVLLIVITSINGSIAKPFRTITTGVFVPVQKGMNYVGLWFSDKTENFQQLQKLLDENARLVSRNKTLSEENTLMKQKIAELDRLKELYKLDQTYGEYEKISAKVIGKNPGSWFSSFVIDKGTKDGIKENMNVIAPGGLVGIVTSVSHNSARIKTVIDNESYVSAKFLSTSELCIVEGDLTLMDQGMIRISNINKGAEVVEGDMVLTSYVSDKYLPEILIGYVTKIEESPNSLTQSGYLIPAVDFDSLEEVFVLTKTK